MTAMGDRDTYDEQVIAEFRARGGVVRGALADTPMLLLRHVGVRSGLERVTPLVWWPAGENAVAVLASNFGAPRHPAWLYNLLGNPARRSRRLIVKPGECTPGLRCPVSGDFSSNAS